MSEPTMTSTLERRLTAIAPFPPVGLELMALVADDEASIADVVDAVSRDATLAAKLLRHANSASLVRTQAADSVYDAVRTLGVIGSLRYLTTTLSATTLAAGATGYGQTGQKLWQDSVVGARAAQELAELAGAQGHVAYTAALLRDIGKMALESDVEEHQERLLAHATEVEDFSLAEKTAFEVGHAEIGAELAMRWRFPEPLVVAIRWHHLPSGATKYRRIAAAVHVGDVAAAMAGATGLDGFLTPLDPSALATLGANEQTLIDLVIQAAQWIRELRESQESP